MDLICRRSPGSRRRVCIICERATEVSSGCWCRQRCQRKGFANPVWQIDLSLFGDKLQYAGMCGDILGPIDELKEHRIGNVQSGQLIESRGRHDDFAAVVDIFTLRAGKHGDGVAAIVFIEPTRRTGGLAAHHAGVVGIAYPRIFVVVVLFGAMYQKGIGVEGSKSVRLTILSSCFGRWVESVEVVNYLAKLWL